MQVREAGVPPASQARAKLFIFILEKSNKEVCSQLFLVFFNIKTILKEKQFAFRVTDIKKVRCLLRLPASPVRVQCQFFILYFLKTDQ